MSDYVSKYSYQDLNNSIQIYEETRCKIIITIDFSSIQSISINDLLVSLQIVKDIDDQPLPSVSQLYLPYTKQEIEQYVWNFTFYPDRLGVYEFSVTGPDNIESIEENLKLDYIGTLSENYSLQTKEGN